MKKTVFTLNIDNAYAPNITELTYPLLRAYAAKIDADFHVITKRRWPNTPPTYEKLQIYHLAQEMKNDWNIYIDSDALVHPDMFDVTSHLSKSIVLHNGIDMASVRWRYDDYFRRDGRNIGSCNWFTAASDWCLDLWHPLVGETIPSVVKNIFPIADEVRAGITAEHLVDDYLLSRNIARYGLKLRTVVDICQELRLAAGSPFLWHIYRVPQEVKVTEMKKVLNGWGLGG